jgi:hypothetical protein
MYDKKGALVLIISLIIGLLLAAALVYFLFFSNSSAQALDINGAFNAPFENTGSYGTDESITFQLKNGAAQDVKITGIGFDFTTPDSASCQPENLPIDIRSESVETINLIDCKGIDLKNDGLDVEITLSYVMEGNDRQSVGRLYRTVSK